MKVEARRTAHRRQGEEMMKARPDRLPLHGTSHIYLVLAMRMGTPSSTECCEISENGTGREMRMERTI